MKLWIISAALVCLAGLSFGEGAHDGACAGDIEKFCKDIERGGGRIIKCLKTHETELSAPCKEQGQKMKEHFKARKEACHADVEKFCNGMKGGMQIIQCLKENEDKVSVECKAQMKNHRPPKKD